MEIIKLQTEITTGDNKEVTILFDGNRRKLVQITLRNSTALSRHKAPDPITVQCIAGKGTFYVGENNEAKAELTPGTIITLEENVIHEIRAEPAVSLLLTRFIGG